MNETREEMLDGLTYVRDMLGKMQSVLTQYINLERNFRAKQKGISTSGVKNKSKIAIITISATIAAFILAISLMTGQIGGIFLLVIPAAIIFVLRNKKSKLKTAAIAVVGLYLLLMLYSLATQMNFGLAIFCLILLAAVVGIEYVVISGTNRKVSAYNKQVEEDNQKVQAQRDAIYQQYLALQRELTQNTPKWFPPDYFNMEAVEFFITAVRNSRADSVKEMVNLFESTAQHKEMVAYQKLQTQKLDQLIDGQQELIAGQREANQQLRFANMMSVASFIRMGSINSGVQNLSAQTAQANRALDSKLGGIASTLGKIKDKLD